MFCKNSIKPVTVLKVLEILADTKVGLSTVNALLFSTLLCLSASL